MIPQLQGLEWPHRQPIELAHQLHGQRLHLPETVCAHPLCLSSLPCLLHASQPPAPLNRSVLAETLRSPEIVCALSATGGPYAIIWLRGC